MVPFFVLFENVASCLPIKVKIPTPNTLGMAGNCSQWFLAEAMWSTWTVSDKSTSPPQGVTLPWKTSSRRRPIDLGISLLLRRDIIEW